MLKWLNEFVNRWTYIDLLRIESSIPVHCGKSVCSLSEHRIFSIGAVINLSPIDLESLETRVTSEKNGAEYLLWEELDFGFSFGKEHVYLSTAVNWSVSSFPVINNAGQKCAYVPKRFFGNNVRNRFPSWKVRLLVICRKVIEMNEILGRSFDWPVCSDAAKLSRLHSAPCPTSSIHSDSSINILLSTPWPDEFFFGKIPEEPLTR